MNKKEAVKKFLGYRNILRIKKCLAIPKYARASLSGNAGKLYYDPEIFAQKTEIKIAQKNVFFGYYDIAQLSRDGRRALIHIVDKSADPAKQAAQLAWYDMDADELHVFDETRAWSWQQGARLRWHPTENDCVLYNDFDGEKYVTRQTDLLTNKTSVFAPLPLYDISPDGQYGLSLNFDRLQRLRPGYGYSCLKDESIGDRAPAEDGIKLWRKEDAGEGTLVISLRELANTVSEENVEHYLNHISISPSGKRFMFFHLMSYGLGMKWKTYLYVFDMEDSSLKRIEDAEITSHYSWCGDDKLLITALPNDKNPHASYILYDLIKGEKTVIDDAELHNDGHPTCIPSLHGFISDTYPLADSLQHIFWNTFRGDHYREIISVYANPFLLEDHRCDLHPRIGHECISFDTTYTGLRSVVILKGKNRDTYEENFNDSAWVK